MSFDLTVYQAGYCTIQEKLMLRDGRWKPTHVPALFFVLDHPTHGRTLIDTGYAPRLDHRHRLISVQHFAPTDPHNNQRR